MSESEPVIDPMDAGRQSQQLILVTRAILKGWDVPENVRKESIDTANALLYSEKEDIRARAIALIQAADGMRLKAIELQDKSERLNRGEATENHGGKIEVVYVNKPNAD